MLATPFKMIKKPAYLVEGNMEQKFIQSVCPNAAVQRINCNGDSVCLESIAKRVGSLGRLLHKRYSPLIVIFDRERRQETVTEIREEFLKHLSKEGIDTQVIVGIPDRDIENWILADYATFADAAKIDAELIPQSFEGEKGKSIIKKLNQSDQPYVETVHGVTWLKSCRPDIMRKNSPSFAEFADALNDLSCWWLDQKHLS